jgi:CheY-like chemotaxis protein
VTELALPPCFHPTTICFVDDNESFLQSLDLELPGSWACRTFTDPLVALEFLERPAPLEPLMDRCFSLNREPDATATIRLDLNLLEQEISHVQRFHRHSVVVVDYAMPFMDGIQFCAALKDPYVRKAMLTGVADEKLAVEAFNAGLIHRFIPKQSVEPIELVRDFVTELVHDYFNQYISRLTATLTIDPPTLLTDRAVARFIESLMAEHDLVEYYLVDEPPGFLMLKSSGEIWRVGFLAEDEMPLAISRARASGAPEELLKRLETGAEMLFPSGLSAADYFGGESVPWSEHAHPADVLQGDRCNWRVSIWKDAPGDIDFDPTVASYDAYLASLATG